MNKALNNEEVGKIAGKVITMVLNSDMCNYEKLEDLFATECVLINYLVEKNFGHWVGLYMDDFGNITFFDSYGKMIDVAREYIPMKYRVESNQDYPYLSKLILDYMDRTKKSVSYNDEQFQRYSERIQTCGRWVGLYFRYCSDLDVESFENMINNIRDEAIVERNLRGVDRDLLLDRTVVEITDKFL
jgi:hypothetical protein